MEEKTDKFFEPLIQQLDGGIDQYNSLKEKGVIEVNIPYYMKGTTYNYTVILVDEAEDLSEKQLKLIGTRVGEGSKIIFAGDYKQSLMNATCDNPLLKMCNEFKGSKNFGCIYLGEDVRSEASKMFASLFEGNDR
jgi:predicted ribonuclease YlaK